MPGQPDTPDVPTPSPSEGRRRLMDALKAGPNRAQVIVAVLLAIVGYAATTQVRTTQTEDYSNLRQSDLIRVFDGLSGSTQRAENEIARLEAVRDDLRTSSSRRQTALTQAREEAATLRILAGTVPTKGPGVRLTITDESGEISDNTLLDVIQELRSAGAEAMEFNDKVRVVAQTYVEETSEGISIDGELLTAPYTIDVIGEPSTLAGSLDFFTGPQDQVEDEGGTLTAEESDEVLIDSVVAKSEPEVADPNEDE